MCQILVEAPDLVYAQKYVFIAKQPISEFSAHGQNAWNLAEMHHIYGMRCRHSFVFKTNYYLGFTRDRLCKKVSRRSWTIPVVLGYINTNIRSRLEFTQILGEIHVDMHELHLPSENVF